VRCKCRHEARLADLLLSRRRIPSSIGLLHFSFVDPYSLGELRLELLRILASPSHMDLVARRISLG
jgi:hypothetical protein